MHNFNQNPIQWISSQDKELFYGKIIIAIDWNFEVDNFIYWFLGLLLNNCQEWIISSSKGYFKVKKVKCGPFQHILIQYYHECMNIYIQQRTDNTLQCVSTVCWLMLQPQGTLWCRLNDHAYNKVSWPRASHEFNYVAIYTCRGFPPSNIWHAR